MVVLHGVGLLHQRFGCGLAGRKGLATKAEVGLCNTEVLNKVNE